MRLLVSVAAFVLASLGSSVLAADNPKAKTRSPIDYSKTTKVLITDDQRRDFLQFMLLRKKLFLHSQTGMFQAGGVCVIEVPVILLNDPAPGGQQYCVALFPEEIHLGPGGSGNSEKIIVWALTPPDPAPAGPATFTFYDEPNHGIILLSDTNKQMRGGALGDGTTPINATRYLFKNKHKVANVAVYLPIVVRTDNPGTAAAKVSVCGTPDPKVVSD